ncbi:hypothetical protein KJ819_00370 [Patescibacteria group bacterium]|nr:hypothetical protein [Patescibacteria group bacterium]MBU1501090.1 hypothetical protein [Patescibacteria group bacterium]MBU2081037.1 hypothetical protein [Patescibacteria group bacterium]MBU2124128.1 hypothetical protein [Patescibacteria group bacterium]MBU2194984.1 hypothetical protein [Patescibacteria group bacterium]
MDTTPITEQPVSAAPSKKRTYITIAVGCLLAVLVILAATLIRVDGFSMFDRIRASIELRNIHAVERNYTSVSVQRFGIMSLSPVSFESLPGTLSDYASAKGVAVGIVTLTDTGAQEIVLLNSEQGALTGSESAKASLAVSSDGSLIAYAAQTDGSQSFNPLLSSWTVRILNRDTGSDIELGTGFGPQFFARDGVTYLLFTTPEGIQVVDTSTAEYRAFTTPFELNDRIEFAVRVAPDGSYLAMRDSVTQQFSLYEIYRVAANMPLGINPTGADLVGLLDVAFANGSVYGVDSHDGGIEGGVAVLRINPKSAEEGKPMYLFPATTDYRLIQ